MRLKLKGSKRSICWAKKVTWFPLQKLDYSLHLVHSVVLSMQAANPMPSNTDPTWERLLMYLHIHVCAHTHTHALMGAEQGIILYEVAEVPLRCWPDIRDWWIVVEQLLVQKHWISGVFDVSVSERENKNAKKIEVCFYRKHGEFAVPVRIQGLLDKCVCTLKTKLLPAVC